MEIKFARHDLLGAGGTVGTALGNMDFASLIEMRAGVCVGAAHVGIAADLEL